MAAQKKTTVATITEVEPEKEIEKEMITAEPEMIEGVLAPANLVGVSRVPVAELEAKLNAIGYEDVLQIIVEPSYSGAYFVIVYKK